MKVFQPVVKLPGAVVGNTSGRSAHIMKEYHNYQRKKVTVLIFFSPARARFAHSWSSDVWFMTKSRQTLMPRLWQASVSLQNHPWFQVLPEPSGNQQLHNRRHCVPAGVKEWHQMQIIDIAFLYIIQFGFQIGKSTGKALTYIIIPVRSLRFIPCRIFSRFRSDSFQGHHLIS